jgi:hypothetical protein
VSIEKTTAKNLIWSDIRLMEQLLDLAPRFECLPSHPFYKAMLELKERFTQDLIENE